MSVFVPLLAGAQVELVYLLAGMNIENRLWFTFDLPPYSSTDLQGLSDGVADWHTTNILPFLSNELTLVVVTATDWTSSPAPQFASTPVSLAGGVASKSYSANVALRVNFRWPIDVRLRRNCNFVPGIPDSAVDLNTPTDAFRDAMFEGYAGLIDAARLFTPVRTWRWVLTSQIENGSPRVVQHARDCIGPETRAQLKLGQRRTRLP